MSIQAYQRTVTQAESPRELEYRAFGKATAGLVRCRDEALGKAAIFEACEFNRKLWAVMSADCALPENGLPAPLRASIVSLAIWVAKYTREVMRDGASVDPLIDVNTSIMEGLTPRSGA